VNGSSVGVVSSYTFNNVQTAYTISATFALAPATYGIPVAIVLITILAALLVVRKRQKTKSKGQNIAENQWGIFSLTFQISFNFFSIITNAMYTRIPITTKVRPSSFDISKNE